jgi:hypothetical protein
MGAFDLIEFPVDLLPLSNRSKRKMKNADFQTKQFGGGGLFYKVNENLEFLKESGIVFNEHGKQILFKPFAFTGEVYFYTDIPMTRLESQKDYFDFFAEFENGLLKSVTMQRYYLDIATNEQEVYCRKAVYHLKRPKVKTIDSLGYKVLKGLTESGGAWERYFLKLPTEVQDNFINAIISTPFDKQNRIIKLDGQSSFMNFGAAAFSWGNSPQGSPYWVKVFLENGAKHYGIDEN